MNPNVDLVERFRMFLDSSYHEKYDGQRKHLQHQIVLQTLNLTRLDMNLASNSASNWIIFTAGSMGSGKSTTIHWMKNRYCEELYDSIHVDMDKIRDLLPETTTLKGSARYCDTTQKESGCIAELCVYVALYLGRNVIVDGSMINIPWQLEHIRQLREYHPSTKVILLHVTASESEIRHRVFTRSQQQQGRFVPEEVLCHSLKLRNLSLFSNFQSLVDCFVSVHNPTDKEPQIVHPWHLTWDGLMSMLRSTNESTVTVNMTAEMAVPTEESLLILPSNSTKKVNHTEEKDLPVLKYVNDSVFEISCTQGRRAIGATAAAAVSLSGLEDVKVSQVKARSIHDISSVSDAVDRDADITFDESYTKEGIETTISTDTIELHIDDHIGGHDIVTAGGVTSTTVTNTTTNEELLVLSSNTNSGDEGEGESLEDTTLSLLLALTALDIKETKVKAYKNHTRNTAEVRAHHNTVTDGCAFTGVSGDASVNHSGSFLAYSYDSQRHHRHEQHWEEKKRNIRHSFDSNGNYFSTSDSTLNSVDNGCVEDSDATASHSSTTSTALGHMVLVTDHTNNADLVEGEQQQWWNGDVRQSHRYESESAEALCSEISLVTQLFSGLKADIESLLTSMTADIEYSTNTNSDGSAAATGNKYISRRIAYSFTYPQYKTAGAKAKKKGLLLAPSRTLAAKVSGLDGSRHCRRRMTTKDNAASCSERERMNRGGGGAYRGEREGQGEDEEDSFVVTTRTSTSTTSSLHVEKGKRKRIPSSRGTCKGVKSEVRAVIGQVGINHQQYDWSRRSI